MISYFFFSLFLGFIISIFYIFVFIIFSIFFHNFQFFDFQTMSCFKLAEIFSLLQSQIIKMHSKANWSFFLRFLCYTLLFICKIFYYKKIPFLQWDFILCPVFHKNIMHKNIYSQKTIFYDKVYQRISPKSKSYTYLIGFLTDFLISFSFFL